MNARSLMLTAAVTFALAGLSGCNRDAEQVTNTAPPPAPSPVIPPADTTATAPSTPTPPAATERPSSEPDRTAGQTVDDAAVTAKVKAALLAESGVDGTKINVDTFNGRVTLKGEVPDKAQIDKAVQIARGIEGVKDVDNRLSTGASS
ncbi:MAG: BON domain-containing protein [Betaproteobacteria bacterium]|nr:MAG: BON domain-containing protein [Betaproteobacteria bacterium]